MTLTDEQIAAIQEILKDQLIKIEDDRAYVTAITRSQLIKLDVLLVNRGIAIMPIDQDTLKIIL